MTLRPGGAPVSIAGGVREFARSTPGRPAVVDGDRSLTCAALDERSNRVANTLLSMGLRQHEAVGVLLNNRLEYPEVAAGIAKAGLVLVPMNTHLVSTDVRSIMEHCGARVLILDDALSGIAADAVSHLGPTGVLSIDGNTLGPGYEPMLTQARAADPRVAVEETDPFCIAYTSGTTGQPKGVVLSHRARGLMFYCAALQWGLGNGRSSVAVAPMSHGAGFIFGYTPVYTGGTVHMMRRWDPELLLDMIASERIQTQFLVPTHAHMLRALGAAAFDSRNLSSLDTLFFSAAMLPTGLKEWLLDKLPGVGIHEVYGSTEAGGVTNLGPAHMRSKPGSVGQPWFMTELRVLGENGRPVRPGEPGELFSRSPFLMGGYFNDPEATAACTTDDGFLSVQDIVRVDEEGFVHIVDRKKDLIISGGLNIYPREIEDVLVTHPAVRDAAVIGETSEQWGEQVAAYLVGADSSLGPARFAELERFCRERMAAFKIPKSWYVIDALPRNPAGKILKKDLPHHPVPTA